MTTIARNFARYIAIPAMIGGAALGLAGMANATPAGQAPTGPGYSYSPTVKAQPAPAAKPGWHNNHGPAYIAHLTGKG
ncbi:MAG: hypothetical protein QOK12_3934 [Mycobacterium sp.]|jgi:hypothetical protein|nr:hypothetical protein [Mycobacterium sp.]